MHLSVTPSELELSNSFTSAEWHQVPLSLLQVLTEGIKTICAPKGNYAGKL